LFICCLLAFIGHVLRNVFAAVSPRNPTSATGSTLAAAAQAISADCRCRWCDWRCDWRCGLCFGSGCDCSLLVDVLEFTPQAGPASEEDWPEEEAPAEEEAAAEEGWQMTVALVDRQWTWRADGKKKTAQCGVCRQLALDCPSTARKP
jgi:hypothetical protein